MYYKCPQCGGTKINQYRMPFGPMWCDTCGYRVKDKNQVPNPFVEAAGPTPQQSTPTDQTVPTADETSAGKDYASGE